MSNNPADQQAHNSVYQKLDQVDPRRQLKLSFPAAVSTTEKKVSVIPKPPQQQLPTLNPRCVNHHKIPLNSLINHRNIILASYQLSVANVSKLMSKASCSSAVLKSMISHPMI